MRVLFASLASPGHAYPLVPLAVAAREAGHEVHFAVGEAVHEDLAVHGLRPFRPADSFYEIYAEDLEPELARLRPDLVVHEWGLPGAAVAAVRAGIPGLWHGFGRLVPEGIGFEPPVRVAAVPHLDICPPSLQDPDFLATAERIELRPVPYPSTAVWERSARPLVYLTFGTAFGTAELLSTAVAGLSGLGADVVVALGRVPPGELARVPEGVTVRAWVPQVAVLARADLVVHHGGSGTTLGALAAGVPQLVLPQGADQFANAGALVAAGAAARLDPASVTADAITDHARTLLAPGPHRDAARGLAAEIARMPSPAEVAARLPALAGRA
ncbi:MAG TPA: glycosyltransferase [Actinophytocola sp.]|jgi:UDP:flavonoid glycosyltransferase YjiC (YdhE family)|nr:glycosyltransferase [Actinophytocola sp.]